MQMQNEVCSHIVHLIEYPEMLKQNVTTKSLLMTWTWHRELSHSSVSPNVFGTMYRVLLSTVVDDTRPVDQWNYDHLTWYPGAASVRRLEEKYLRQNPQVRAHSSATAEVVSENGEFDSD